ncbi:MAG: integrase [Acinetobacter sp.]|nr:integrase [Acinetobacter sp.]
MASFRKRGGLQWQARIARQGYPAQVKTFNTKAEAEAWARDIEREMDRGSFVSRVEAESTTLMACIDRYTQEVSVHKRGHLKELYMANFWKTTPLAGRFMSSIRSADIAKLRDDWLKTLKPATVLRRIAFISHVFTIARKEWRMESINNPVELIRKPQPNNARTRRLNDHAVQHANGVDANELDTIVAASGSDLLPAIVVLAIETAMRRGEIAGMQWEHVDLKRRFVHLPETKNGSSRDVPLSPKAISILAQRQKVSGSVFELRADAITKAFDRARQRARQQYEIECEEQGIEPDRKFLKDLRFHDLRHEATSRLASIFPLHELTKITGHKDPRMLMRYYHPRAEDLALKMSEASKENLANV